MGYPQQIEALMPPGRVWKFEAGAKLRDLFAALGDELERVRLRGLDLIEETDPRTATETLPDWERVLALPDELVTAIPATDAGRRVAITQKYVARGGQNYDFFDRLCAACGWPLVSITLYAGSVLRVGARVGDRVYGVEYAYAMLVTVSVATAGALTSAQFEAVIRHSTHAHISVMFAYV